MERAMREHLTHLATVLGLILLLLFCFWLGR